MLWNGVDLYMNQDERLWLYWVSLAEERVEWWGNMVIFLTLRLDSHDHFYQLTGSEIGWRWWILTLESTQAQVILCRVFPAFVMYYTYGLVRAIPTYRVYRLYDNQEKLQDYKQRRTTSVHITTAAIWGQEGQHGVRRRRWYVDQGIQWMPTKSMSQCIIGSLLTVTDT